LGEHKKGRLAESEKRRALWGKNGSFSRPKPLGFTALKWSPETRTKVSSGRQAVEGKTRVTGSCGF